MTLISNIRFQVLAITLLIAGVVYFINSEDNASLIRYYGLLAAGYLYLTLLASPVARFFAWFPWRGQYLKARRALGVSSAFFALLHGNLATFTYFGGPTGVFALPFEYQWPLLLGVSSMWILALLACTSFDRVVDKIGFANWKLFHRLVYYVGVAVVIHAFTLGTHLNGFSHPLSWAFAVAIAFLVVLEIIRIYRFFASKTL